MSETNASYWQTLLPAAMVGTDKMAFSSPALSGPVGASFASCGVEGFRCISQRLLHFAVAEAAASVESAHVGNLRFRRHQLCVTAPFGSQHQQGTHDFAG